MKRMYQYYAAAALVLAESLMAASNPWIGTWKLNRGKSTLTGSTTKVVKNGNAYHFDLGAVKYDLIEDGMDHPTVPNHTTALKVTGNNEWESVDKVNGAEVSRAKMVLSSDGRTLNITGTGTHADSSTYKTESKLERVGAGSGLAGTWRDVAEDSSSNDTMMYSDAGGGKVKLVYVESKDEVSATLDGMPAAVSGPRSTPGQTMSLKKVSPTELKYTILMSGKTFVEGTYMVSTDGKVLKDVSWLVSQPTERTTLLYEKQ